jgi:glycosyltransferase involved in cell wall biosynthesis
MTRRVLLLLGQMPQDPASGAARSMRTICRMLAANGSDGLAFEVSALATTASDAGDFPRGGESFLRAAGFEVTAGASVLRFDDGGVRCALVDTGGRPGKPGGDHGIAFARLFEEELARGIDVLLTYGGRPHEIAWRLRARERGAAVVFGLRNWGYLHAPAGFFSPAGGVDAVLASSRFHADRYRHMMGVECLGLPEPLDVADVFAPPPRQPEFATYVNPSPQKGVMFFARLADELARRRPDLPMRVVESRGKTETLFAAARRAGLDLQRHKNLRITPGVARPAEIYAVSRILLVPSVWEEPSGRVAAEALLNGVPPVVSGRGGLEEVCAGGGCVLPLPDDLTVATARPVDPEAVGEWIAAIERLFDDETHYAAACERARQAGRIYFPENLGPRYREFFAAVSRDD